MCDCFPHPTTAFLLPHRPHPAERLLEELLFLRPPEFPLGVNNPSHSEEVEGGHSWREGLGTQCVPRRELTVQHVLLLGLTPPAAASLFLPAPFQAHLSSARSTHRATMAQGLFWSTKHVESDRKGSRGGESWGVLLGYTHTLTHRVWVPEEEFSKCWEWDFKKHMAPPSFSPRWACPAQR